MTCLHEDAVPVDVRNQATGTTETVAYICRTCLEQLPANHGCEDCEWSSYDMRRLCDSKPVTFTDCTRPCKEHQ